jgi:hypothetical protein
MFSLNRHPSSFHRLLAAFGVALVLLLTVLAASPELHAWSHGHESAARQAGPDHAPVGDADHECAVTLFASGAGLLLAFCLFLLAQVIVLNQALLSSGWLIVTRPHFWLVPSHAPPAGLN